MRTNIINVFISLLIFGSGNIFAQDNNLNQFDSQDRRHGKWEKVYPKTGNIRYSGQFDHGGETGTFKFYTKKNPDHPKATKTYSQNNNFVSIKYFDKKGKLKSKGKLKNRKRIGTWTYFFAASGTKMMTEDYQNDKLHGWKKVYYKNGKLTKEQQFKNGKEEGVKKMYSENGTLSQMYTYRNGKLNGPSKLYNKSGEVIESGNYKNGRRKGLWKYFKNGQLEKTKKFPLKDPASERRTGEPEGYKDGGKPDMSEIRK